MWLYPAHIRYMTNAILEAKFALQLSHRSSEGWLSRHNEPCIKCECLLFDGILEYVLCIIANVAKCNWRKSLLCTSAVSLPLSHFRAYILFLHLQIQRIHVCACDILINANLTLTLNTDFYKHSDNKLSDWCKLNSQHCYKLEIFQKFYQRILILLLTTKRFPL